MRKTRVLLVTIGLMLAGGFQSAQAIQINGVPAPLVACFYECVLDSTQRLWKEVTGLVIPNPSGGAAEYVTELFVFDGNETLLAVGETHLSEFDLDTINICESLDQSIGFAPKAGVVYLHHHELFNGEISGEGFTPAPGWVKNYLGSFIRVQTASRTLNPDVLVEPHNGKLISIGKTGCRLIWRGAPDPGENEVPFLEHLVYIEETGEDPVID